MRIAFIALAISMLAGTSAAATSLEEILAGQPQQTQARYQYRHPQQTLEFFGITPGMTVVEALPGGGWYSKILLPLLGDSGELIGADYPLDIWPLFGGFANEEFIAKKKTWPADWTAQAEAWRSEGDASLSAFVYGELPQSLHGTADAVVLIRAMHNLARFADNGDFLQIVLEDSFNVLKPGGIAGVVQHQARPDMPDDWASGAAGYLKKSHVIEQMQEAGFEYVASSDVNENPKDQPTSDEFVWRLPPSLQTSKNDAGKRAAIQAIGESNRMTLKFVKPEA